MKKGAMYVWCTWRDVWGRLTMCSYRWETRKWVALGQDEPLGLVECVRDEVSVAMVDEGGQRI